MRFKIKRPFGRPVSRNYSRSIITNKEWGNIQTNLHVARVDVDTAETQPKTHALMPAWKYGNSSTMSYLEGWHNRPVVGEQAAVEDAVTVLQDELDQLNEKATKTAADTARISELERDIVDVRANRYWTQAWNTFGDGRPSLYRACSAPNVPFKRRSNWTLEPDRPFTFFVHRCKPHEAQQDCWVRVRFGHWALIFSQEKEVELVRYKDGQYFEGDDQQAENPLANGVWKKYDGANFDLTDEKEDAISQLRDGGRLTISDRAEIARWQAEMRDKKADLSKNKKIWTADQKAVADAYIADRKKWIEDLKETKRGLSSTDEIRVKRMEDELYVAKETVQFTHAAESTFNTDLAITIIPQPRGFIVFHNSVGRDYFVYEDEEVTGSGLDQTIVTGTKVQVDGNGGALWFSMAYVVPERYSYLESFPCSYGGVEVSGQGQLHWDASLPPGSNMLGTVSPAGKGRYVWKLELFADPDLGYMPFLYRLYFDLNAQGRDRSKEVVVFDSSAAPAVNWNVGFSRSKENRGRAATLMLALTQQQREQFEWLGDLSGHQLEVEEKGEIIFSGTLGEASRDWIGKNRKIEYRAYDHWSILNEDKMWSDLIGDARTLADYVRRMVRGGGFHDDEIIIADNAITRRLLPHTKPGEEPALQPEWGGGRGDFLTQLLADFGYFHDMWLDGRGRFHFEPIGATSVDVHLRSQHISLTDRNAVWDVKETINKDNLKNHIIVMGRKQRGRSLSSVYTDFASVVDPTCPRFRGRAVAADPYHSDALTTQQFTDLCCRWRAWQEGQVDREFSVGAHYRQDLNVGDRFKFDSWVVELLTADADDRLSEQMRLTMRVVT